ncbi:MULTISPECIES: multicopper oxidase family protein [Okeania]|uniref:Multicopper oxidase family protein n=3 Tax=Microcoleaceae TaxID=1892252 RepID=A0A3N6PB67_9CYAN|nr:MULTISPECIES: multicopper oxidase family protein [Okeania]NES89110.1 multicopper oxidase family protein [Okeania sp. SIO2B9]RQH43536.1 multicopper oxidase family protein [Okeania hirsuta]
MKKINRRRFLNLSSSSAIAVLIAQCSNGNTQEKFQTFSSEYKINQSQDGLLEVNLIASINKINLGNKQAYVLNYNGQIPGPRLEAKPGDTIRINFTNKLPQPTNIHYHGLHIPITGNADNVFLKIAPGDRLTYQFQIPQNHPAGLFWYHPHFHGLTAEQLFGGLAGLFIVRGELDEIPEVKAAEEKFLVLQDFALDRRGNLLPSQELSIMTGREGDLITVNGQSSPNLTIPSQGLLRLRILNASTSRFYRLSLEEHPFYLIATDGGALTEPIEMSELLLTPGERADILIQANREPGKYRLLNLPYKRVGMGMMGRNAPENQPQVLATVSYDTKVAVVPLPTKLIPVEALPKAQKVRHFQMNHGMIPSQGMAFVFNGQPYQLERIDTQVQLNTVEDWELINTGIMDHPFHVHGNAFQVVSRNGKPEPYLAWKDVVLVRPGEKVLIRIPFRDFPGKTVYHCHILDHEDLGMMGNLEIQA